RDAAPGFVARFAFDGRARDRTERIVLEAREQVHALARGSDPALRTHAQRLALHRFGEPAHDPPPQPARAVVGLVVALRERPAPESGAVHEQRLSASGVAGEEK